VAEINFRLDERDELRADEPVKNGTTDEKQSMGDEPEFVFRFGFNFLFGLFCATRSFEFFANVGLLWKVVRRSLASIIKSNDTGYWDVLSRCHPERSEGPHTDSFHHAWSE
jgi:hypothetical protein